MIHRKRRMGSRERRLRCESLEDRRVLSAVTVSTPSDVQDGNVASISLLVSNPGPDGKISLREAILAANSVTDADTITFAANINTISLTVGELSITTTVTIDASMLENGITIDASMADQSTDPGDGIRIFNITGSGSTLVTLKNLMLTGGDVNGTGGAITSTASLTLQDCIITGNQATGEGGGVRFDGTNLEVNSSTLRDNTSGNPNAFGASGGGMFAKSSNGAITIEQSIFDANRSMGVNGDGAGAYLRASSSDLTIIGTTITGNRALGQEANAGGLLILTSGGSPVEIDGLQITDNHADDDMGGLYVYNVDADVTLKNCTISNNTAGHTGGAADAAAGIWLRNGAVTVSFNPTTTIENSTISGNVILPPSGPGDAENVGGAGLYIQALDGTIFLRNSTISGNRAQGSGGGIQIAYGSTAQTKSPPPSTSTS